MKLRDRLLLFSTAQLLVFGALFALAYGAFERSIRLPEFVDGERIAADLSNGVLTVTVPKARAAQPRKIEINGGATASQGAVSSGAPANGAPASVGGATEQALNN